MRSVRYEVVGCVGINQRPPGIAVGKRAKIAVYRSLQSAPVHRPYGTCGRCVKFHYAQITVKIVSCSIHNGENFSAFTEEKFCRIVNAVSNCLRTVGINRKKVSRTVGNNKRRRTFGYKCPTVSVDIRKIIFFTVQRAVNFVSGNRPFR